MKRVRGQIGVEAQSLQQEIVCGDPLREIERQQPLLSTPINMDTNTITRQKYLERLKKTRTTALRLFTMAENKLKSLLSQHESVSFITHQLSELQALCDNAAEAHDDYTSEANFTAEEAEIAET